MNLLNECTKNEMNLIEKAGIKVENRDYTADELKKCERDIGDENKIIGNIYEGKFFNNVEIGYQLNDILDYCNNCKIYPICRGGCRKMRELEKSIKCEQEKEHLLYLLKMLV